MNLYKYLGVEVEKGLIRLYDQWFFNTGKDSYDIELLQAVNTDYSYSEDPFWTDRYYLLKKDEYGNDCIYQGEEPVISGKSIDTLGKLIEDLTICDETSELLDNWYYILRNEDDHYAHVAYFRCLSILDILKGEDYEEC